MRFSFYQVLLIVMCSTLAIAHENRGQEFLNQKITLKLENKGLESALRQIKKATSVSFIYSPQMIGVDRTISINVQNESLKEVLSKLLTPLEISYEVSGSTILLRHIPKSSLISTHTLNFLSITSQLEKTVTGTIVDEKNQPMPGVNIAIKGTTRGVTSLPNGKYSIQVPNGNNTLIFSFVGYLTQEITINSRTQIDVAMSLDMKALDEVVVVGYGEQKKESVVGAITTVKVNDLKSAAPRSLNNVLAGKVAGVIAVQRSGEPGYDDAQFWIRGISTFGAGASPLVLVDGVERPINNIEPEEIETFSVLKDASATAVYGIRGANGVILVTTRRGTNDKPSINFKYESGVNSATSKPKFVDAPTYLELYNEAQLASNPNYVTPYTPAIIEKYRSGADPYLYPNVDWLGLMLKPNSKTRRANLNISGGSVSAKYFISATYYDESGIWNGDNLNTYNTNAGLKRYNFRANTDVKLSKNTELKLGLGGILITSNYPGGGSSAAIWNDIMFNTPVGYSPTYPLADSKSGFVYGGVNGITNPYTSLTGKGFATEWRNNIQSDITINHDLSNLVKGLKASAKFAFDGYNFHNIQRTRANVDTYIATGRAADSSLILNKFVTGNADLAFAKSSGGNRRIYMQANLNYDKTIGNHSISGLVLYNQQDYQSADANDAISALPSRLQGLVGRISYSYKSKYFFEYNAGYNGSENFEKGKRFGYFPAYAVGWIISQEPFFRNNLWLQYLKVRGSYGNKGNDQIGGRRFAYLTTVGGGNGEYRFGIDANNTFGGRGEDQWGADLTWEKEVETNIGLEVRFLRGFYLQADVFKRHRTGIFMQRNSLPAIMGLQNNPWGNIGEFENKGVDGSLEYNKKVGNVSLALRGNVTYTKNKLLNDDAPDWKYTYQNRRGKRYQQPFGLIAEGLFTSEEEIKNSPTQTFGAVRVGDIKYKDFNGDGVVDSFDEVAIGNPPTPGTMYGFGFTVGYKGFDVSAFFQGAQTMDFMLGGTGWFPFVEGGIRGNVNANAVNRWTPENPSQDVIFPRLSFGPNNNNYRSSTWWQRDASYLRLKSAEIGYTLPKKFTKKLNVNTFRVYVAGFNLHTWSDFTFWDPELGDGRGSVYPIQKNFNVGVNINL